MSVCTFLVCVSLCVLVASVCFCVGVHAQLRDDVLNFEMAFTSGCTIKCPDEVTMRKTVNPNG